MDQYSGQCSVEMWELFLQVYDLDDDYLVEEILHLDFTEHEHIESIIANYMKIGKITSEERDALLGYYILTWHDGDEED